MLKTAMAVAFLALLACPGQAWSQVSKTETFHLSVTIPAHVNLPQTPFIADASQNPVQMVQIQPMVRDHKTVMVRSVVVP